MRAAVRKIKKNEFKKIRGPAKKFKLNFFIVAEFRGGVCPLRYFSEKYSGMSVCVKIYYLP